VLHLCTTPNCNFGSNLRVGLGLCLQRNGVTQKNS
jgi:hypothetical protein